MCTCLTSFRWDNLVRDYFVREYFAIRHCFVRDVSSGTVLSACFELFLFRGLFCLGTGTVWSEILGLFCPGLFCLGLFCYSGLFCPGQFCLLSWDYFVRDCFLSGTALSGCKLQFGTVLSGTFHLGLFCLLALDYLFSRAILCGNILVRTVLSSTVSSNILELFSRDCFVRDYFAIQEYFVRDCFV